MKSIRSFIAVLAVPIVGAIWLIGCGSAETATKVDRQSFASRTSSPTLRSATAPPRIGADSVRHPASPQRAADIPAEPAAVSTEPTPTPVPSPTTVTEQPAPVVAAPSAMQHTIQPGETLLKLAKDYGVSMAAIQLANGMGDSVNLIAGHTLSIPTNTQWPGETSFWIVHVVRSGETLVGLSSAYELRADEILRVNAIADPALIRVNQNLIMPMNQLVMPRAQRPTATTARLGATPAVANDQSVPPSAESGSSPAATQTAVEQSALDPSPIAGAAPDLPPSVTDWSSQILVRINQARAEYGLNALNLVPELTHAAQAHAEDCARRGWGSHVGSDGAALNTRLERAGYFGRNWGENWVQALNAERAFEWWYGEIPPNDPHRRNILSPHYNEIGIGFAETAWGYIFVTDFGRR